ncbi:MAG: GHKL domain-containing protein [Ruminococcus sp.]|nr:GHKL domain-containing protein [Ruminococcus sp.]
MTDIFTNILNQVGSYLCIAAVMVFLQSFYDSDIKFTRKKALLVGITALVEVILLIFYPDNIIVTLLSSIVCTLILVYDCGKGKFKKALKIVLAEFCFLICTTNTTFIVSFGITPNYDFDSLELTPFETYSTVFANIFFFGGIFLYLRFRVVGKGLFIPATKKEHIFIAIYFFYSFVIYIIASFVAMKNVVIALNPFQIVMAINTILLSLLFPLFVYANRISEFFRESTEYQKVYLEAELKHFQQYKLSQEETKCFRHDIKNNLICLNELFTNGKTEEAGEYLKNLLGEVQRLSQKYVTGDEMLDSIVSSKAYIMEQNNIEFSLEGVLAGGLNIEPVDICSIFANALDNAIEAIEFVEPAKKQIKMNLKATNKLWLIQLTNPVTKNIDSQKLFNNGYSTKKDKKHHGIGTYNMKKAVEKYGGAIEAKCENNNFILEIILPRF